MIHFSLLVSTLAGHTPSDTAKISADSLKRTQLAEGIVSASRVQERVVRSLASLDMLDAHQIRPSAQPSHVDTIENLRGIQVNYRINPLKRGATNLLDQPYTTFVAEPGVGVFYYFALTWP